MTSILDTTRTNKATRKSRDQHMEETLPENHPVIPQKDKDQDIEQGMTHDQHPPLQK
jgi:hypothetical protein